MTTFPPSRKVILITDADCDIGAAIARHLAAHGHQVMLGARSIEQIAVLARDIAQGGRAANYLELDLGSRGSVMAFLVIAEACYGRIDALVNTAGMASGIVAVLPIITAQGVAQVIHVPTDHALHARTIAEQVGLAIDQPGHVGIGALAVRSSARA
ncbi:MAG: oxidoreductase [Tardiphaga sp.]|jgi:NADP-dependent 3-hydroxy acid dehydrogenase YdfG|nr:oxidoreductase [Tardiphaga sp.]